MRLYLIRTFDGRNGWQNGGTPAGSKREWCSAPIMHHRDLIARLRGVIRNPEYPYAKKTPQAKAKA